MPTDACRLAARNREDAIDTLAADNPAAAWDQIERSVDTLADHPELGRRGRVAGTREWVIPRTSLYRRLSHLR